MFLHPSALLLYFVVQASGTSTTALDTIAVVLTLLTTIVLHELGHALMARRYGIRTADITLYIFGGVARLERMPRASGPELLIALAGPAVNFVIVLASLAIMAATPRLGLRATGFLDLVYQLNLGLGLFNLLPIFPMDGGRVLRALLSLPGRLRATEIAAWLGRALAIAGGVLFLINGMYLTIALAFFVYMAGSAELRRVRGEGRPNATPGGLVDFPTPPTGFRWADRGDGVCRLVPVMAHVGGREHTWN